MSAVTDFPESAQSTYSVKSTRGSRRPYRDAEFRSFIPNCLQCSDAEIQPGDRCDPRVAIILSWLGIIAKADPFCQDAADAHRTTSYALDVSCSMLHMRRPWRHVVYAPLCHVVATGRGTTRSRAVHWRRVGVDSITLAAQSVAPCAPAVMYATRLRGKPAAVHGAGPP